MRVPSRLLIVTGIALATCAPSSASAAGAGGTQAPAPGAAQPTSPPAGGTRPGSVAVPAPGKPRKPSRRAAPRPVLALFHVGARRFYDLGRPARVAFRIEGRSSTVRVKLLVLRGGTRVRTIDLGDRTTRRNHSVALTGREGGPLPEGRLQLRLTARDPRGRGLRASSRASAVDNLSFHHHRLPLVGAFDYGGPGGRFGAGRPGHVHQGQDLTAAPGTPVVAPRGGVVQTVAYQPGGAGNYIVLKGTGENRSYVFMHLLDGSTRVREGDRVATGERLGDVGSTGASSGPHLHFEVWAGPWFDGGRAVDPLPYLRRWDSWS